MALTTDLNQSRGKLLSWNRGAQLLDWHYGKFRSTVETKKLEAEASKAKAMFGLAIGGGATLAFLIILFFFLFVKIERNLRVVRTREVAS